MVVIIEQWKRISLMTKVLTLFFAIIEYLLADLLATTEAFRNMVGVGEKQNSSHFILAKLRSFFWLLCY